MGAGGTGAGRFAREPARPCAPDAPAARRVARHLPAANGLRRRIPLLFCRFFALRIEPDRHVDPHAFRADDRLEQRDDLRRQVVLDALLPLHLGAARRLVVRAGRPRERPSEAVEDDDRFRPETLHAGSDEIRDPLHRGIGRRMVAAQLEYHRRFRRLLLRGEERAPRHGDMHARARDLSERRDRPGDLPFERPPIVDLFEEFRGAKGRAVEDLEADASRGRQAA